MKTLITKTPIVETAAPAVAAFKAKDAVDVLFSDGEFYPAKIVKPGTKPNTWVIKWDEPGNPLAQYPAKKIKAQAPAKPAKAAAPVAKAAEKAKPVTTPKTAKVATPAQTFQKEQEVTITLKGKKIKGTFVGYTSKTVPEPHAWIKDKFGVLLPKSIPVSAIS